MTPGRIVTIILGGIAVFIGLGAIFGSFYTVGATERVVLTRNGAFQQIIQPGFNTKLPFIDGVYSFSTKDQNIILENEESFTYDSQIAQIDINVTFQINDSDAGVKEIFLRHGSVESYKNQVVIPVTRDAMKRLFSQYTAERAVRNRDKLSGEIEAAVAEAVNKASTAGRAVRVKVTDISWSKAFNAGIEQRMLAEVEVSRLRQREEQEKVNANITVIQAKAIADSQLAKAEAEAKAITLVGDAQASAIRARANALGQNPNLVLLTQAEKWDGKLPDTMVPGTGVPMLQLR